MATIDVSRLTLAEIEAIAARLEAAARVFRDAREMLGGAGAAAEPTPLARRGPALPAMDPSMAAQREALIARNRETLPDDIKRAEGL